MSTTRQHAIAQLESTCSTRSAALWQAYQRFCVHHDRARFETEVQAIRDCRIIDFLAYREALA